MDVETFAHFGSVQQECLRDNVSSAPLSSCSLEPILISFPVFVLRDPLLDFNGNLRCLFLPERCGLSELFLTQQRTRLLEIYLSTCSCCPSPPLYHAGNQ